MRRAFLLLMLMAASLRGDELRIDTVRESLTATHIRYQQYIDGIPVIGGERIERIDPAGRRSVRDSVARLRTSTVASAVVGDVVYLNTGGEARLAIRKVRENTAIERYVDYYDAATGQLLRSDPLFYRVSGRVFAANPVETMNDPALRDANDDASAVPDAAYRTVELLGLPVAGSLAGPNVQIVDTDRPFTARAEASQPLIFDRSQPQFEEVNAYFHIDQSQRYLRSLGFDGARRVVAYAIPVDPHAVNGTDNSFYVGGSIRGQGSLFYGDGGTDDAEDSDIMLHEFGHAIHDWIAPDAFNGSSSSQARAVAEGFGDYWAFSSSYETASASGRDPFCIGDWDARCAADASSQSCSYPSGSDCLRRVDGTKTMRDYLAINSSGIEHANGEIWSSALREIFMTLGRRTSDRLVIEGMFGTLSNPSFVGQARKLLEADVALYGGANARAICRAMTTRGILSVTDCAALPRGEITLFQSHTSTIRVSDIRPIQEVVVRVQLDDDDAKLTLTAPDGTSVVLATNASGDATYGVDALPLQSLAAFRNRTAFGDWKLMVEGGSLRSWSLMIQFAGDVPLAARPFNGQVRKHIAAVAHTTGVAGTTFVSDVAIYNRATLPAQLMAVYTPTGADGSSTFGAVRVVVEPNSVVVLSDVVQSVMHTSGTGQLELMGDIDRVIVTSTMFTPIGETSYGQTIPVVDTTESGATQIAPLQNSSDFRSNVGVAEVGGVGGRVRFAFFSDQGAALGTTDVTLAPFGHAQTRVPVAGTNMRAEVSIAAGAPRFIAYGSVIDNLSGDAITIPAARHPQVSRTVAIPFIHGPGAGVTNWRTDLWRSNPTSVVVQPDLGALSGQSPGAFFLSDTTDIVSSRTYTTSAHGTYGQFIPAIAAPASATPQHIVGVQQSTRFRTNVGLVNFSSATTDATVIVYDAAGREAGRAVFTLPPRTLQQLPLAAIVGSPLRDGRVEVRANGSIAAYGSVIDNSTEDPFYIVGQF